MIWFLVKNIQEESEEIDQTFSIAIHFHPSPPQPKMLTDHVFIGFLQRPISANHSGHSKGEKS